MNLLGLGAGVAILLLGFFVLLARPRAAINRTFFLLALLDGMSNLLFELREMAVDPTLKLYYMATFYYFFVAFLVGLVVFALLFPRPWGGAAMRPWLLAGPVALGLLTLTFFAFDHSLFYTARAMGGTVVFPRTGLGQVVNLAFPLAAAIAVLKLSQDLFTDPVPRRRRQAALVLGGLVVAYGAIFLAYVWNGMQNPQRTFLSGQPLLVLENWVGYGGFVVLLGGLGVRVWRSRGGAGEHRPFLMGCLGGAVALSVVAAFSGAGFFLVQIFSLLVYPVLLAYAIVSAEAFQINPQLRRATMLTLSGAGIAGIFVVAETFMENFLASSILGFLSSDAVAGVLSALLAASLALPTLRLARRVVNRFAPDLTQDARHVKNLAVYRLTVEGALEDGILDADESRALAALRDGLGVSHREHARILADVKGAQEGVLLPDDDPAGTGAS